MIENDVAFGRTHRAPETSCATHSSRGRMPFDSRPKRLTPSAVAKHLLEIEKTALLNVTVTPSEQGKRVYERLQFEPRPVHRPTSEVLGPDKVEVLRFLLDHPDATATEVSEELGLSEYTALNDLRVLTAVGLVSKQRGPAIRRGVPPYVYRATAHGQAVHGRLEATAAAREM